MIKIRSNKYFGYLSDSSGEERVEKKKKVERKLEGTERERREERGGRKAKGERRKERRKW